MKIVYKTFKILRFLLRQFSIVRNFTYENDIENLQVFSYINK